MEKRGYRLYLREAIILEQQLALLSISNLNQSDQGVLFLSGNRKCATA